MLRCPTLTVPLLLLANLSGCGGSKASNNDAGAGEDSGGSIDAAPGLPGAPQSVTATGEDGDVRLGWAAPASDGGSPILGYNLRCVDAKNVETPATGGPTATTGTVTPLKNFDVFNCDVRAFNAVGVGPAAAASGVTPRPSTRMVVVPLNEDKGIEGLTMTPDGHLGWAHHAARATDGVASDGAMTWNAAKNVLYQTRRTINQVDQWAVNADGTLTSLGTIQSTNTPHQQGIVLHPNGASAYSAGGMGLLQFDVSATGVLSPKSVPSVSAAGTRMLVVHPDGQTVYSGYSTQLYSFRVATDGSLSEIPSSVLTVTHGGQMLIPDSGNVLYAIGYNDTLQFHFAGNGALQPYIPPGAADNVLPFSASFMAVHPNHRHAYLVGTSAGDIQHVDIAADGTLVAKESTAIPGGDLLGNPFVRATVDPSGRFLLVADCSTNLHVLRIADDGSLTLAPELDYYFGNTITCNVSAVGGPPLRERTTHLYVASGASTVSQFSVGTGGLLTALTPASVATATTPLSLLYRGLGDSVFVGHGAGTGVEPYASAAGALTALTAFDFTSGSGAGLALVRSQRELVVAQTSDRVQVFALNDDGTAAGASPSGTNFMLGTGTAPSAAVSHPSNHWFYVTNSGTNTVAGFETQMTLQFRAILTKTTVPLSTPTWATGARPVDIVLTPDGAFAYVVNRDDDTVSSYSIGSDGLLTSLGTATAVGDLPLAATIDATGKFLYVVSDGAKNISAFAIAANGALTPVTGSPFTTGNAPTDIGAAPVGPYLYVANADGTLLGYTIAANGALTPMSTPSFPVGSGPRAIGFRTVFE